MDASPEASAQTLAGIDAGPEPAHGLAASMHQWSIPSARGASCWPPATRSARAASRRATSSLEVVARGIDAISITMRAARQAFSD
jgi:hypothetical protein